MICLIYAPVREGASSDAHSLKTQAAIYKPFSRWWQMKPCKMARSLWLISFQAFICVVPDLGFAESAFVFFFLVIEIVCSLLNWDTGDRGCFCLFVCSFVCFNAVDITTLTLLLCFLRCFFLFATKFFNSRPQEPSRFQSLPL